MEKNMPRELAKIEKIVADIREFPAKIDSPEQAKNARCLLKKYALLSEKIERSVLIRSVHQKDLANIRTAEFKEARRILKEKANSVLHAKNIKNIPSEKNKEKSVKKPAPKKETVKKSSSKSGKATASKKEA